ncbi:hypothetical protein CLOM_g16608 [Closterium sp. NIES-68]|nr:hypothetical protein CLOM_g16608 [Closterium sp. NIES-68]
MNDLNLKFQKREVDVTEVATDIDATLGDLRHRYVDFGEIFGVGAENTWLSAFLAVYGRGGTKRVKALAQSDAPLAGLRRAAFVNRRM